MGITSFGFSQEQVISKNARISVLTCGSGAELYSAFGHSAFRVWDPVNKTDYVYNYGIFDFNAPNFYLNFVQGRPLFKVSKQEFSRFLFEYQYEKRWVKEQVLDLEPSQKIKLYNYLENNIKPENSDYIYDYLYNNCATKIIDVIKLSLGDAVDFKKEYLKEKYTFRELMGQKIATNTWGSFGINLALGSPIDKQATTLQHTFLPDYVFQQIQHSSINGKPLVLQEKTILKEHQKVMSINFLGAPLFWFVLLLACVLFITYFDYKNEMWSKWLDAFLMFITGIAGLVLVYLWIATNHTAAAYNFNLLWAFPFNLILFYLLITKNKLPQQLYKYCILLLVLLAIIPMVQLFGVQKFHPAFIPIILSLAVRYIFIWHKTKN
ncbi:DUF4105 domain-containing protein [Cellulophaga sp. F20128]|uniref:lipoprotein N-acyltransferase Lnb domain-containing protein n=1 Tax=Cellulophaga sp. F20128 TaxID=2926413 RepID=UPI001FF3D5F7|nr:DUF4105 domain-containing protein [Cellulophaga sp. F20128]MCK0157234.1 DUF4105 domain-containing protein [Cellulophaga sp. F20128]